MNQPDDLTLWLDIVTNALLTLLFFRAVYRKAPRPMQAA